MKDTDLLAWIDIETTGLDPLEDSLLEVACIITTQQLVEIARKEWVIEYVPQYGSKLPEDFVVDMHTGTGLWRDCTDKGINSFHWINEFEVFLNGILNDLPEYKQFVMSGSGVARFDFTWFQLNYQRLLEKFAYYCFDVGIFRRALVAAGVLPNLENKNLAHRAMQDIEDHLEEWKYYRSYLQFTGQPLEVWVPNDWRSELHDNPT